MISTLKCVAALSASLAVPQYSRAVDTRLLASARPRRNAARSDPNAVPITGPLRQRPAGRRSVAAMSAEEHVEPFAGLPGRGARGGAAGRAQGRSRAGCRAEGGTGTGGRRRKTESATVKPAAPALRRRRLRQPRRPSSRAARRFPRSAARAAPTIRRSAPACRPAALRRCNAWKRTRPRSRRLRKGGCRGERRRGDACGGRRTGRGGGRPAAAPAATPAPALVLRPMRPREELFVLRSACGARRPRALRRRSARRRPHRAVPGDRRPPRFRRPARRCWPSSRRNNRASGGRLPGRAGPSIRHETPESAGSAGPTGRCSRPTSTI